MPIIAIGRVLSSGCDIQPRFNVTTRNDVWADITNSRVTAQDETTISDIVEQALKAFLRKKA